MKSVDQKYVMRAPPRRRTKGDEPDDQPVFLRKAFAIITSCPIDIGGWSAKGDTVVIRDVKQFSEKVLPTAYKHNNFSSFVRQLNFYGFRKVKAESMDHAEWWEFRHPQFLRDEPHLLSEIKRSVHFSDASSGQEMTDLKTQVNGLNDQIAAMHDQIDKLTGMVTTMQLNTTPPTVSFPSSGDLQKKRKVTVKSEPGLSLTSAIPLRRLPSVDSTVMIGEYEAAGEDLPSGPELMKANGGHMFDGQEEWTEGVVEEEDDDMAMLFTDTAELLMDDVPSLSRSQSMNLPQANLVHSTTTTNAPTAAAIGAVNSAATEISSVLESLSPELRLRFVDRLAEVMGAQLTQNIAQQVQVQVHVAKQQQKQPAAAVAPSPTYYVPSVVPPISMGPVVQENPSEPAVAQFCLPSGGKAPEIALPLASAAIAALLSSMQSFAQSTQLHMQQQQTQQAQCLNSTVAMKECK